MKLVAIIAALAALTATALFASGVTAQEQVDVAIDALNDSGVTGSATVEDAGDGSTDITINLTGVESGSSHVNHIHEGTGCGDGEYAGIVQELNNVDDGSATTNVAIDFDTVANGSHVLVIHAGASLDDDPTPVACGSIPVASIIAPPPTGTGYTPGGDNTAFIIGAAVAAVGLALVGAGWTVRRSIRA